MTRAGASVRRIADDGQADACFFRSRAQPGRRKVLLQITERCDLRCAHCFVSATAAGSDIGIDALAASMDRLVAARVANVTLTGGEPLVHPELPAILELFVQNDLDVTICTNGVSVTDAIVALASRLGRVRFNVSLDGFSARSHGRFRGKRDSFDATVAGAKLLAEAQLLKGILSTPNALADPREYEDLYRFSQEVGVDYLLMNPLSNFGRGVRSRQQLRADDGTMDQIRAGVDAIPRASGDPETVFIRFPNQSQPLTDCVAGEVLYVFVNGDTAVCPYLVFGARTPRSQHSPDEFIAGNLFLDPDFARRVDEYDFHARYRVGSNPTCVNCSMGSSCGKGCPAAVIASGGRIGGVDAEMCPITDRKQTERQCS